MTDPVAAIVREPGGISLALWLLEIARNPALQTMESKSGVNPFTRQPMQYHRPYAASVRVDGRNVGSMIWEANHILISGELDAIVSIAKDVAVQLQAKFLLSSEFPEQINDQ
jgi:hypothetical protein